MSTGIKLTLIKGNDVPSEYVFTRRTECVAGRAPDCDLSVPADPLHLDVSRHHCAFDVDPPVVRVRDLGSRNGTFVNGVRIGQRKDVRPAEDATIAASPPVELHSGDEVQLGQATMVRVDIVPPPEHAARAGGARSSRVLDGQRSPERRA